MWDCSESPSGEGRFEYRGGSLPAPCREALPQLAPAVDAIAGLRGFVGVDFIWNAARPACHDPGDQPATDHVVRRAEPAVPPGPLARSWLAACDPAARDLKTLTGLAGLYSREARSLIIHGQWRAHC